VHIADRNHITRPGKGEKTAQPNAALRHRDAGMGLGQAWPLMAFGAGKTPGPRRPGYGAGFGHRLTGVHGAVKDAILLFGINYLANKIYSNGGTSDRLPYGFLMEAGLR